MMSLEIPEGVAPRPTCCHPILHHPNLANLPTPNTQDANESYMDEDMRILELSQRASELFQKQEPREKRRLLNFALSNCTWMNGKFEVIYRQPFDILMEMKKNDKMKKAAHLSKSDLLENWLPDEGSIGNYISIFHLRKKPRNPRNSLHAFKNTRERRKQESSRSQA